MEVMERKGVPTEEALKRVQKANLAFPEALVKNYKGIIKLLKLPDPKDRHVLAAAIKINADVIITNNLKDFPKRYLRSFGLGAQSADGFLTDIIDFNPHKAILAFREMVLNKKRPNLDEYKVLDSLYQNNLKSTADYLHVLL